MDRKAYAGSIRIEVHCPDPNFGSANVQLTPNQTDFEIGGLSPGEYVVSVMSPYERVPDRNGGMTSRLLVREKVTVHPGETRRVDFKK